MSYFVHYTVRRYWLLIFMVTGVGWLHKLGVGLANIFAASYPLA